VVEQTCDHEQVAIAFLAGAIGDQLLHREAAGSEY
jgi:hypothetical protein